METDALPIVLLGAGFNADAKEEAGTITGRSIYIGEYDIDCKYPLVSHALELCFGISKLPAGRSIEMLFADALSRNDGEPMKRLCDELMKADYYLFPRLWQNPSTSYHRFFSAFGRTTFLTFNYDALAELFLLHLGLWYPHDGYGVPVDAELGYNVLGITKASKSQSLVLHPHGSFCLYPSDAFVAWEEDARFGNIRLRDRPRYIFDPDSIGTLFAPFERLTAVPTGLDDSPRLSTRAPAQRTRSTTRNNAAPTASGVRPLARGGWGALVLVMPVSFAC